MEKIKLDLEIKGYMKEKVLEIHFFQQSTLSIVLIFLSRTLPFGKLRLVLNS